MSSAAPALAPITVEQTEGITTLHNGEITEPGQKLAVAMPEEEEENRPDKEDEVRQRTAELAYKLWQERGCPIGSDHIDWHNAELMLHAESMTQGS